jgi:hypothetical protein
MKVFDAEQKVVSIPSSAFKVTAEDINDIIDKESHNVSLCIEAYHDSRDIAKELYNEDTRFSKTSVALYNKYMKSIHQRLNIAYEELSFEDVSIVGESGLLILSQEGIKDFIKGLWEKIKQFFMKIVNGVKTFFKNYLTSKGIAYRKLKNIEEVLSEKAYVMDKGVATSDKVPSGIKSRFKTEHEQLTPSIILDIINNANPVFLKELVTVSQVFLSNSVVKSELKNAVNKMKELQAKLMVTQYNKKDYLDNVKDKGLIKGTAANLQQKADVKNVQKELDKTKQEVEKQLDASDVKELAQADEGLQTQKLNEALETYKRNFNSLAKSLIKEKEVYFANGKVLKLNEDDKEDGFLVFKTDTAENAQPPKSVIYADQQTLLSIVKRMIVVLTEADNVSDQVNKFLTTADKTMTELDSLYKTLSTVVKDYPEDSPQAKSMNALSKQINAVLKPFTQSLKNAISQTFKLSTNILDNAISVAHGVIAYGVESMKLYTEK